MLRKFLNVAGIYFLIAYSANMFLPYLSSVITVNKPVNAFQTAGVHEKAPKLPKNANLLMFLNASNLALAETKPEIDPDCDDYARSTLDVFDTLTEVYNRSELKKKVRMTAGMINDYKNKSGHIWLQYLDRFGWKDYDPSITPRNLVDNLPTERVELDYLIMATIPGTRFPWPVIEIESFDPSKRGQVMFQVDMKAYYRAENLSYSELLYEEWFGSGQ